MTRIQQLEAEVQRLERMLDRSAELELRPSRQYERRRREALRELAQERERTGIRPEVDPSWFAGGGR